jgi:ABC-2 type transport system ATP-binding protein
MATMAAIEVEGLTKRFGAIEALGGISFAVDRGELFGCLGPNGAGKTTTINLLTGLARPDAGTIRIADIDCTRHPKAAQHMIGVVPDESNLYPELTGFQNLGFCGALYGMRRPDRERRARELLDTFGLAAAADRRFAGYSRGMKRRLTIAAGLIHRPAILFLDEPTTGVDVVSARRIRQLIGALHRAGTTIFLTTHYIEEAERLCERIAFLVGGRLVHVGRTAELLQAPGGGHAVWLSVSEPGAGLCEALAAAFPGWRVEETTPGQIRLEATQPIRVGPLVRWLEARGVEVLEVRRVRPSLEDVFVRITGTGVEAMQGEPERGGDAGR